MDGTTMLLGCIADDLTGATDLALTLTRGGMRTVQVIGVPPAGMDLTKFDAVVVALKSRTNAAGEAVTWSLESARLLQAQGARQLFFKYCSTFDSTDQGNIGPVAEALLAHCGGGLTLATPAFPTNKRTVYQGNLFVGGVPLAESPMKDHPLTPMRDSNLVRVLQRQTKLPVGLVPFETIAQGAEAISKSFAAARARGERIVVVDAITDANLMDIGRAATDMKLVTGGSGAALGLPANFLRVGLLKPADADTRLSAPEGRALIIAGSCSEATRGQVEAAVQAGLPALKINPLDIASGSMGHRDIVRWAKQQPADKPVLIYSSADPTTVRAVQDKLGRDAAGCLVERELAAAAKELVAAGFNQLIIAGGETSGAVVTALGVTALEIGPEIDPGVPWTRALGTKAIGCEPLVLALKSGNFGAPNFFLKAWEKLA
jgi:3-dehydrotetronate 4-kinase